MAYPNNFPLDLMNPISRRRMLIFHMSLWLALRSDPRAATINDFLHDVHPHDVEDYFMTSSPLAEHWRCDAPERSPNRLTPS